MQLSFSFHQKKREKKKKVKATWEGKGKENIVIPQMENDSSFISVYLFPLLNSIICTALSHRIKQTAIFRHGLALWGPADMNISDLHTTRDTD